MSSPKRYRKKQVEVEAVQWTGENRGEVVAFVGDSVNRITDDGALHFPGKCHAWSGDYIIRDGPSSFASCAEPAFHATYEPVEEGDGEGWPDAIFVCRDRAGTVVPSLSEPPHLPEGIELRRYEPAHPQRSTEEGELQERNAQGGLTTFGLFKASLRWATDWIEKCNEVPSRDDEWDDWLEFAAAQDLLKEPPATPEPEEGSGFPDEAELFPATAAKLAVLKATLEPGGPIAAATNRVIELDLSDDTEQACEIAVGIVSAALRHPDAFPDAPALEGDS